MGEFRTDRQYWCEMCARQKECYSITRIKPKCFVPKTDRKIKNDCETCRHKHDGTVGYCMTCGESNYEPKEGSE